MTPRHMVVWASDLRKGDLILRVNKTPRKWIMLNDAYVVSPGVRGMFLAWSIDRCSVHDEQLGAQNIFLILRYTKERNTQ